MPHKTHRKRRLLLNRLRPFRRSSRLISRVELLARLEARLEAQLVIIHGPAGFGKTSLMTQYFDHLQSISANCGWLSLDPSCQDPVQLLAHLLASLDGCAFLPKEIVDTAFSGFHGLDETEAMSLVLNSLSSTDQRVHILIDDIHTLDSIEAKKTIRSLIDFTSSNVQIVVASRAFPSDLKSNALLAGTLLEISVADLAFSEIEARELLSLSDHGKDSDALVRALFKKTEGWPAALEFAKLWVSKQRGSELSQFVNESTDFVSFLMTEVFDVLPVALQDVMLQTSVLNRFNGELIEFLCDRTDGWDIINQLLARDLLLAVDQTSGWYRYHNVFGEFLQDRFKKENRFSGTTLHARAAEWHTSRDLAADGIRHAVASSDPNAVLSALERSGGWHLVLDGRISTIRTALADLDENTIRHYPMTYMGYLMLMAKNGDIRSAIIRYDTMRRETDNFSSVHDIRNSGGIEIEAEVVGFYFSIVGDQPNSADHIASLKRVLSKLHKKDYLLLANVTNYLCYSYFDGSFFDKAYAIGERSIVHYRELKSLYGENFLYFHLGKICLAQGRLRDAEHLFEQGRRLANENFGDDNNMVSIAAAHLAELHLEKNEIEQAKQFVEVALTRIEDFEAWFDIYISAYFSSASIAQANQDYALANKVLRRASIIGRRRTMPRLRLFALSRYSRLLTLQGKLSKANWVIRHLDVDKILGNSDPHNLRAREELTLTVAYYYIRSGQPSVAIPLLSKCMITATRTKAKRSQISLNIALSIAYFKDQKYRPAMTRLNDAIELAQFEGFKRPFLQYGGEILPLLDHAIVNRSGFSVNRMKRSFLTALIDVINKENRRAAYEGRGILTRREREVARYVSEGCSNKEIARHCYCSENTVKFHLKNIFAKLNVRSRKDVAKVAWEPDRSEIG